MSRILTILFVVVCFQSGFSQKKTARPRLVVGVIVDQMRQEYLYRFSDKFGDGGFKRLINDGYSFRNAQYNYVPTITGPGHASVYTGSTPAIHGIIGNEWYDKAAKKLVNCIEDERQKPVGVETGNGKVSPWRLLSSTVTDELKLSNGSRSRTIGISMKDRGAVLPAGHTPDGAYWFDSKSGKFISSSYYMSDLPGWVKKFNSLALPDKYLSETWNTLLPIDQYTESAPDDSPYETKFKGKDKAVFPYKLGELRKLYDYDLITSTPFGDDLLTEFVKGALDGEELGKDEIPDFLTISFSSPDYVGHAMGPKSVEIEDTYLRLDKNIGDLLQTLDQKVGAGNYTLFLTADHAVADAPQYLSELDIPAGYFSGSSLEKNLNDFLVKYFPGKAVVEKVNNNQVFLNQEFFSGDPKTSGIEYLIASELISKFLLNTPGIAQVYTESVLRQSDYGEKGIKGMMVRGYNHQRSGDLAYVLQPGWVAGNGPTGTSHGSPYAYDTNVPIIFYGFGVKKGSTAQYHAITDIAPTLSLLLNINPPSGCTGQPLTEILD
jgi:predicted AlkP superfamily pyrophosphatase or phosphodiesterase